MDQIYKSYEISRILKGTIIGLGIGVIASFALKAACKKSNKNKIDKSSNLEE